MRQICLLIVPSLLLFSGCNDSGPLLPGLGGEAIKTPVPTPLPSSKALQNALSKGPGNPDAGATPPAHARVTREGRERPEGWKEGDPAPPPAERNGGNGGRLRHEAARLDALPVTLGPTTQCDNWPLDPRHLTPEAREDIERLKAGAKNLSLILTPLSNGGRLEVKTESESLARALQDHVGYMANWLRAGLTSPDAIGHPIYQGLHAHADETFLLYENTKDGIRAEETGSSAEAITFIHAHLALIERYTTEGKNAVDACQSAR